MTAYEIVNWDKLSPYAQQEIDRLASEHGVTLHAGTDVATLRRFIGMYERTSW